MQLVKAAFISFLFLILIAAQTPPEDLITVNTPSGLVQCGQAYLSWTGGVPPYSLQILHSGSFTDVIEQLPQTSSTSYVWTVNQPAGSSFTLGVSDSSGNTGFSSTTSAIGSGSNSCLGSNSASIASNPATMLSGPGSMTSTVSRTSTTTTIATTPSTTTSNVAIPTGSTISGDLCLINFFTVGIGLFQPYIGPLGFGSSQCSGNSCQFDNAPNSFPNGTYICDGAERVSPDNNVFTGFGQYDVPPVYACGCGMSVNDVAAKNGHGKVSSQLCPSGCDLYVQQAPSGLQCNTVTTCSFGSSRGDSGTDASANCIRPQYYLSGNTSTVVTLESNEGSLSTTICTGQASENDDGGCLIGNSDSTQTSWCSCSGPTGPDSQSNPCNLIAQVTSTSQTQSPTSQPTNGSGQRWSPSSACLLTMLIALGFTFLVL